MCVILIGVHLYAFTCMSAILDLFISDINVAFNLTWEGLGIMLITASAWFDLVMESYVSYRGVIYLQHLIAAPTVSAFVRTTTTYCHLGVLYVVNVRSLCSLMHVNFIGKFS